MVQSVELNRNFTSRHYFNKNRLKFPKLEISEIKEGYGEDLAAAGIADNSVDAVVVTLVLCSVHDQVWKIRLGNAISTENFTIPSCLLFLSPSLVID